jgi:sugar-specific transcriptional regulator TrmB
MIKDVLAGLGMTANEIEIYLVLLKSGQLSVNDVGEKAGLHRQVCYDALERLLEKGFVSYTVQNSKKYFQALNPEKILDYLDEKKELVNEVMPELVKMTTLPREDTFVEVIKGKNVIRTVLRDVINTLKRTKGELLMLGVEETKFVEEDRIAIQQYLRDLKRFGLKERLIAKEGAELYFTGEQSEYRLIGAEHFNPNPVYIYSGKIVQVVWGNPTHAVMIKSKEVFDSNRKYFEMLWKIAKPLNRGRQRNSNK